jgi:predicted transcriptional regulator
MITACQIRAARALLDWSKQDLADKAIISVNAVARLEKGEVDPRLSTITAVQKAIAKAGVVLLPNGEMGEGARFAKPKR